jgi:Tol biopolymer transport system component
VNVAVGKLRTALGDSAENPLYIETLPRRGYRFVGTVEGPAVVDLVASPPNEAGWNGVQKTRSRFKMKTLLFGCLALIVCAAVLGAGVWLGRRSAKPLSTEIQRLTVMSGTVYAARFAPGGRNVIYAAAWEGAPIEMFSTDLKFHGSQSVSPKGTDLLAVSSAGEMAVLQPAEPKFMTGMTGTLGQMPLNGGSPRQIAENVEWADWSPDGKSLAVVRSVAGEDRLEFPLGHVVYETYGWVSDIRVSPNGRQIAFLDHPNPNDDRGEVSVVDLDGRKTVLSSGWECEVGLAWSPRGNEVWFSATRSGLQRQIYAVDLSGRLRLAYRALGGVTLQDIAPDGRVLMTLDEWRAGIMGEGRGATKEQDLAWQDWSLPADISRDGKTLLFDEQGERTGPNYTVATREMTGSAPVALGEGVAGDFSPDGKWVAATVSYRQLMLLPTGAGTAKRVEQGGIEQYAHSIHWLPGGKQLLFSGNLIGHAIQCFVQNIDGGKPRAVTPEGSRNCQVSADGKFVSANGPTMGGPQLYAMDGGAPRAIPGLQAGESVQWTSDPNSLFVFQRATSSVKVFRLNILTGQRKFLKEIEVPTGPGVCDMGHVLINADGTAYVYGYVRLLSDLYIVSGLK